jgi:hypothetical protein
MVFLLTGTKVNPSLISCRFVGANPSTLSDSQPLSELAIGSGGNPLLARPGIAGAFHRNVSAKTLANINER